MEIRKLKFLISWRCKNYFPVISYLIILLIDFRRLLMRRANSTKKENSYSKGEKEIHGDLCSRFCFYDCLSCVAWWIDRSCAGLRCWVQKKAALLGMKLMQLGAILMKVRLPLPVRTLTNLQLYILYAVQSHFMEVLVDVVKVISFTLESCFSIL